MRPRLDITDFVFDPATRQVTLTWRSFPADRYGIWRDVSVSPRDDGSHWNHNGGSFLLIGDSMGSGLVEMLAR